MNDESNEYDEGRIGASIGQTAHDRDGNKVGEVADLYYDTDSGHLEWLAVTTGLFGSKVSFVPIAGSTQDDDGLVVAPDKATIKDAPRIDPDGRLTEEEERALYAHYGLESSASSSGSARDDDHEDTTGTGTTSCPRRPRRAGPPPSSQGIRRARATPVESGSPRDTGCVGTS
ncbi:MAG: PRC-barrel domain-containing protein [Ilumatobacteraceae bacterium]